jgi:cellulose synthase/poly-beta-1,6-N-acetylglucosamine synthase-like glycosyltransferase
MEPWPLYLYYALFALLSVHGLHRAVLVAGLLRRRRSPPSTAIGTATETPSVTVQLPIFNELYVAERLIDSVAALDWPAEKLEIQVLDDSNDETATIVAAKVADLQKRGVRIEHLRRETRDGYKAGALANGLSTATGNYVAIFDADFVPQSDFLQRTVPFLEADAGVALVQARWDWTNRQHSLLTNLQAVFLDAHFAVEHEGRERAGHFINFNGTAGVWRRSSIDAAGGWSHDTVTEDLDLSFRAQMAGLRFKYLHEVGVPSELPIEMNAFKTQQRRWSQGSLETARKLLVPLMSRRSLPLGVRLEGAMHLLSTTAYALLFAASVLALPAAMASAHANVSWTHMADVWLVGVGLLPVAVYFLVGQLRVGRGVLRTIVALPATLALGIGISFNNSLALLTAGKRSTFVRTPKYQAVRRSDTWLGKRYLATCGLAPVGELVLAAACSLAVVIAWQSGRFGFAAFLSLFASGYLWVGSASLFPGFCERLRRGAASPSEPTPFSPARTST